MKSDTEDSVCKYQQQHYISCNKNERRSNCEYELFHGFAIYIPTSNNNNKKIHYWFSLKVSWMYIFSPVFKSRSPAASFQKAWSPISPFCKGFTVWHDEGAQYMFWKPPWSTKIEKTNREPTWLWRVSPPSLSSYAVIPPSIGVLNKFPHVLEKLTEGHLASLIHCVVEQGSSPKKRVFAEQDTVNAC